MTLSRDQARLHRQAEQLIALRRDLREHEQQFVLENWQESASTEQVLDGAFFTPLSLARCVASQVVGDRLIDLGAGIGGCPGCAGTAGRRVCPRARLSVSRRTRSTCV